MKKATSERRGYPKSTELSTTLNSVDPKKSPDAVAEQAAQSRMQAVTIWVGASWGFRTQGSANALNRSHEAFAAQGYRVLSVDPYIENGDLQGFFVTYQRPGDQPSQP